MTWADRGLQVVITIVIIIGGYQFYFYAQRARWFEAWCMLTRWDALVPYDPRWVWIYAGLYYPLIVLTAFTAPDWGAYAYMVGCFLALLAAQMPFFLFFPSEIPMDWRPQYRLAWVKARGPNTWSQKFLDFVWSIDARRNSIPSMHVSMATMVDMTLWESSVWLGAACLPFPVLIAISAIKTKQHFVADVIPGAVLAVAVFTLWHSGP